MKYIKFRSWKGKFDNEIANKLSLRDNLRITEQIMLRDKIICRLETKIKNLKADNKDLKSQVKKLLDNGGRF